MANPYIFKQKISQHLILSAKAQFSYVMWIVHEAFQKKSPQGLLQHHICQVV